MLSAHDKVAHYSSDGEKGLIAWGWMGPPQWHPLMGSPHPETLPSRAGSAGPGHHPQANTSLMPGHSCTLFATALRPMNTTHAPPVAVLSQKGESRGGQGQMCPM